MAREKNNSFRLGIFVIVASVLLIAGIYFIGTKKSLFGSTFTISTVFSNAGGLQVGNNVRYAGINVGTVSDITIVTDSTIRLDLKLVQKVQPYIRRNAVANLSVDGIVGSALVNITPGIGEAASVEEGDLIQAANLPGTADLIATLGSTNENIALFARDLLEISGKITHGSGTFNLLLEDSVMSNSLKTTLINLENTSRLTLGLVQRLDKTVTDMQDQQGLVNQLIHDTMIMSNLRNFSNALDEELVHDLDSLINSLDQVGDHLGTATLQINGLLEDIRTGEGTINQLIYDKENAESLQNILKNIESGSAKFNEDMEALQHNFLFRRYFRKKAKSSKVDSLTKSGSLQP